MANRAKGKRIVPEVRGAFLRALKDMANKGRPLHDIIIQEFENNPLRALDTLSKFIPKELLLDVEEDGVLAEIMKDISGKSTDLPKPVVDEQRPGIH